MSFHIIMNFTIIYTYIIYISIYLHIYMYIIHILRTSVERIPIRNGLLRGQEEITITKTLRIMTI